MVGIYRLSVFEVFLALLSLCTAVMPRRITPPAGVVAPPHPQIHPMRSGHAISPGIPFLTSGAVSRQARATTIPAAGLAGQSGRWTQPLTSALVSGRPLFWRSTVQGGA